MKKQKAGRAAKSDLAKRNIYKFMTNRLAIIGLILIILILVVSLLAPVLTPYDPNALDTANRYQAPSGAHLLGTDQLAVLRGKGVYLCGICKRCGYRGHRCGSRMHLRISWQKARCCYCVYF